MAGHRRAEATPSSGRLCPAMTVNSPVPPSAVHRAAATAPVASRPSRLDRPRAPQANLPRSTLRCSFCSAGSYGRSPTSYRNCSRARPASPPCQSRLRRERRAATTDTEVTCTANLALWGGGHVEYDYRIYKEGGSVKVQITQVRK